MGVIEKQSIQDIADAIRDRNGLTTLYKPRQMDEAIRGLYKTEAVNHIFDNLTISTTAQGSSITITDADTTKQAEITEIRGKTGKNLLPIKNGQYSVYTSSWNIANGIVTMTRTDNTYSGGAIDLTAGTTGRWASTSDHKLTGKGGTYTISITRDGEVNYNTSYNAFISVYVYVIGESANRNLNLNIGKGDILTTNRVIELAEDEYIKGVALYGQYCDCENLELEIQLEKGDQATAFEPYKVVSGDNEVVVSNKNLINIADRSGTISNFYYYDIPTNYLLEVGETYTVSYDAIVSLEPFNVSVGAGTTGYQRDIKTVTGNVSGRISVTFTPTAYQLALGNKFYIRVPRYNTPQTSNFEIKNIQLEKSNVATEYIEHQGSSKNITLARIPSEYQEVEYIQSNGSQYINTGYNLWNTTNWKIQADFSIDEHYNYNAIFGYDDITDTSNEVWIYSNTNYSWRACGRANLSLMQIPLNTRIEIIHDNSTNNFITTLNGVVKWNTTKLTNTSNHNLCFGHRAEGGWLKGKIYGLKLWSEGTLVRDFIPCYKISDNIAGLYDTVNNVFYPNANTGSSAQPFISGEKNRTTIQLSENDKLWNNNGTWQLNDTAITDNYLLEQLQALENIELYEDLCYVDWVGNEKADMSLLYYVDGEKILEEIRKE